MAMMAGGGSLAMSEEEKQRWSSDTFQIKVRELHKKKSKALGKDYGSMLLNKLIFEGGVEARDLTTILEDHRGPSNDKEINDLSEVYLGDFRLLVHVLKQHLDGASGLSAKDRATYERQFWLAAVEFSRSIDLALMVKEFVKIIGSYSIPINEEVRRTVEQWTAMKADARNRITHSLCYKPQNICLYFQSKACSSSPCKWIHACYACHQFTHGLQECPTLTANQLPALNKFNKESSDDNARRRQSFDQQRRGGFRGRGRPRGGRTRAPFYQTGFYYPDYYGTDQFAAYQPQPTFGPQHGAQQDSTPAVQPSGPPNKRGGKAGAKPK